MNKDFNLADDKNVEEILKQIESHLQKTKPESILNVTELIENINSNYKITIVNCYNIYESCASENKEKIFNLIADKLSKIQDNYIKIYKQTVFTIKNIYLKNEYNGNFRKVKSMERKILQTLEFDIKNNIFLSLDIFLHKSSFNIVMKLIEKLPDDLFKKDPNIEYMTGLYLMSKAQHEKALSSFRSAEAHGYNNKPQNLYYNIGICLLYKGEKLEALNYFSKIKNCKNVSILTYYKIGQNFGINKDYNNAVEFFKLFIEKSLRIDRYNIEKEESLEFIAQFYFSNKDYDNALYYSMKLQKIQKIGKLSCTYFNIGLCLFHKKNYEEAIKNFELSIKDDKDYINRAYHYIAECNVHLDRYEQALFYFEKVEDNPDKIFNKAYCYYQLEKYSEAYKYFQKVTSDNSDFHISVFYMCLCLIKFNDITQASEMLNILKNQNFLDNERCREIINNFYEILNNTYIEYLHKILANIYDEMGVQNFNETYKKIQKALEFFGEIQLKNPEIFDIINSVNNQIKILHACINSRNKNLPYEILKNQLKYFHEHIKTKDPKPMYLSMNAVAELMLNSGRYDDIIEILGLDLSIDDKGLQYIIGLSYIRSKDKKDSNKAIDYLKQSADQEYKKAQYILGIYYLEEEFDSEKAIEFLKKSRKQGYEPAKYLLEDIKTNIVIHDKSSIEDRLDHNHEVLKSFKSTIKKIIVEHKEGLQKANNHYNENNIDREYESKGFKEFIDPRNKSAIYVKLDLSLDDFKDLNQIEKNKFKAAFEKGVVGPDNKQGMKYIKENGHEFLEIKIMGSSGDLRLYGEIKKDKDGIKSSVIDKLKKTHEKEFLISR